jgi:hypothetical protein
MKRAIKHRLLRIGSDIVGLKFLKLFDNKLSESISINKYGYVNFSNGVDEVLLKIIDEKVSKAFTNQLLWNNIYFHCKGDSADKNGAKSYSPVDFISDPEMAKNLTNFISLKNPLLVCPELVEILRDKVLFETIASYLGPRFALSGSNIRKSFVTDFDDADTNKWHVDGNSGKILKLFFYLNDVTDISHGPTEYIIGSHQSKHKGWDNSYRILDQVLRDNYHDKEFISLLGKYGQIRLVDTTGIHRGIKVEEKDRIMITMNFCTHSEFPLKSFRNDLICDFSSPLIKKFKNDYPIQSRLLLCKS